MGGGLEYMGIGEVGFKYRGDTGGLESPGCSVRGERCETALGKAKGVGIPGEAWSHGWEE